MKTAMEGMMGHRQTHEPYISRPGARGGRLSTPHLSNLCT